MASGHSEILGAKMRVTAKKTGPIEPDEFEFNQFIMTEEDGGWSYDVDVPGNWEYTGQYQLTIYDDPDIPKSARYFNITDNP